jgi:hypothetical protein
MDIHGSMDKKQLEYDGPGIWSLRIQHQAIEPYYSKFNSYRVKERIPGDISEKTSEDEAELPGPLTMRPRFNILWDIH